MLREYQKIAVSDALEAQNGILVLPTGSGKSHIIAELVRLNPGRSIILQPTKEILESNLDKIHRTGLKEVGIYSASMGQKSLSQVTYATIGSIISVKNQLIDEIELLIIDECHLTNAKNGQYLDFIKTVKPKRMIGLTATPYRLSTFRDHITGESVSQIKMLSRTRPKIWNDIVHVTQSRNLIQQGFLVEPEFKVSGKAPQGLLKYNTSGSDYTSASIDRYALETQLPERISASVVFASAQKHILVFVNSLELNDLVVEYVRSQGYSADSVSGETPKKERESKLADFKSGKIKVMVNVGVLTIGYDFPELDCIIGARPTMSLALYYQMIGRCVRPVNVECSECHGSGEFIGESYPVGKYFDGSTEYYTQESCDPYCRECHGRKFLNQKPKTVVYDLVNNYEKFGNPFNMLIVKGRTGLHSVMSETGRLTGRNINEGSEYLERIDFGKYKGSLLKDVPKDYIEWYLTGKKSSTWHMFDSELLRREYFKVNNE